MADIEILEQTINDLKEEVEKRDDVIAELKKILSRQNFQLKHYQIDREWQLHNSGKYGTPSYIEAELVDGNIAKD